MKWGDDMYRRFRNPVMRHLLLVLHGRTPFEFVLMLALVLSGIRGLLGGTSVTAEVLNKLTWNFPELYYGSTSLAAVVVLISLFVEPPQGLKVERAGLTFMAGLLIGYGVGLFILVPNFAVGIGGALVLAMGLACAGRSVQIKYDLMAYGKYARELNKLEDTDGCGE